jgi:hypothetical protein
VFKALVEDDDEVEVDELQQHVMIDNLFVLIEFIIENLEFLVIDETYEKLVLLEIILKILLLEVQIITQLEIIALIYEKTSKNI